MATNLVGLDVVTAWSIAVGNPRQSLAAFAIEAAVGQYYVTLPVF